MKILLTLFLLIILGLQAVIGQTPVAKKVDELRNGCDEGIMSSVAGFAAWIHNESKEKGFIIFYGGEFDEGNNLSLIEWLKFYAKVAGFEVSVIRGANRKEPKVEFWIVPEGAEPPKPTTDFVSPLFNTKVRFDKADAFIEPFNTKELQPSHSETGCQLQPNLAEFAKVLLSNNGLNGLVIVNNPSRKSANLVAEIIVKELTKTYKLSRFRFRLKIRYKAEFGEAELWFIPKKKSH